MARPAGVRWDEERGAWRSNVGPRLPSGRRKGIFFRHPPTAAGKKVALAELVRYLADRGRAAEAAQQRASAPVGPDGTAWSVVIRPYLEHVEARVAAGKASPRTLAGHAERLRRWMELRPAAGPWAGARMADRMASTLGDEDWQTAATILSSAGCGPLRVDGVLQSVHAAFEWAVKPVAGRTPRRLVPFNPFAKLPGPELPRRYRNLPTRAEVAAWLRAGRKDVEHCEYVYGRCSGCIRARVKGKCRRSHTGRSIAGRTVLLALRLQLHCGTRPDELCRASWQPLRAPSGDVVPGWIPRAWVDPATGLAWGQLTLASKTTRSRGGQLKVIPVPPLLARAIERMRAERPDAPTVLLRPKRGAGPGRWDPQSLGSRLRAWRRSAGLGDHLVLYNLRHGWYTRAVLRANLSADAAGDIGGTSGDVVRSVYIQADVAAKFEGAARVISAARPARTGGGSRRSGPPTPADGPAGPR